MSDVKVFATLLLFFAFLGGGVWLAVSNYNECRNHGFSFLYCITRK
jgi:hypothetical protein